MKFMRLPSLFLVALVGSGLHPSALGSAIHAEQLLRADLALGWPAQLAEDAITTQLRTASEHELVERVRSLVASYVAEAAKHEESGQIGEAFELLSTASTLEICYLAEDEAEMQATREFAALRSRILSESGTGLLAILGDQEVPGTVKLSLIAELGRLIQVRTLAQSRAHDVPRTPETVEEKIREVLEERRQRLATLEYQDDPKAEWPADDSPLMQFLVTFSREAAIRRDARDPVGTYNALLRGRGYEKQYRVGGEKAPVWYTLLRFEIDMRLDEPLFKQIVYSPDVEFDEKTRFLAEELGWSALRGDLPTQ